jgi:hypothetical protein
VRQALKNRRSTAAVIVLAGLIGLAGRVTAEPRLGGGRGDLDRQLSELKRQAHELEEKIRRIEAELAREARARAGAARAISVAKPQGTAECALPFYMDSAGIKHLRAECLESAGQLSCDLPYTLDERGVRRVRPACESGAAVPARSSNE